MRTHVDQRRERLLELLRTRGRMRVADVAAELDISVITARRDVEALAGAGRVVRTHGEVAWPKNARVVREGGPVIGMLVPVLPYYFSEIVRGAQAVVAAAGGRLSLAVSQYRHGEDVKHVQRMLAAGIDGLLITPSWWEGAPIPGYEAWLAELPVPTVLVERAVGAASPAIGLDRVRSAAAEGCALAVRHLAALGHERIALLQQPGPHSAQVRSGFQEALAVLDLWRPEGGLVVQSPFGTDEQDAELDAAVQDFAEAAIAHNVTAALVHNDRVAIGAIPVLAANGLAVPDRLALVSYDDEVAELADAPLTALAPPKREVGADSARLVLRRITERSAGRQLAVQHLDLLPELRVRVSCGIGGQRADLASTERAKSAS